MPSTAKKSANVTLAENIRYWMKKRRLEGHEVTQMALAQAAGVSQKTISNYLNPEQREGGTTGREPSAKIAEVAKIAAALEVEMWKLMREASSDAERDFLESLDEGVAQLRERAQAAALKSVTPEPPQVTNSRPLLPAPNKRKPGKNHS